jgi:hypothetical protein
MAASAAGYHHRTCAARCIGGQCGFFVLMLGTIPEDVRAAPALGTLPEGGSAARAADASTSWQ